jgi:hypothetical protein
MEVGDLRGWAKFIPSTTPKKKKIPEGVEAFKSITFGSKIPTPEARHWWLLPIILANWEAEVERIMV